MARALLAVDPPATVEVTWHEDVDAFHPGQSWIWQPGGFGVFDAGINALSILTAVLPETIVVRHAEMTPGPGGAMPIAATIDGITSETGSVHIDFDWRVKTALRQILVRTQGGRELILLNSGRHLSIDGTLEIQEGKVEYARIYERLAQLIASARSEADLEPLRITADAFMLRQTRF